MRPKLKTSTHCVSAVGDFPVLVTYEMNAVTVIFYSIYDKEPIQWYVLGPKLTYREETENGGSLSWPQLRSADIRFVMHSSVRSRSISTCLYPHGKQKSSNSRTDDKKLSRTHIPEHYPNTCCDPPLPKRFSFQTT